MVVPSFLPLRSLRFSETRNGETGQMQSQAAPIPHFPSPNPSLETMSIRLWNLNVHQTGSC